MSRRGNRDGLEPAAALPDDRDGPHLETVSALGKSRPRPGCLIAGFLLVLLAGGATLHWGFGANEPTLLVGKTRGAIGKAGNLTLEEAADYWLASASEGKVKNIRGSGTALAIAIRLGRLEALRSGTKPISDRSKRLFRRQYADEVLDAARWTVAVPGSSLGRVLARWPVKEGAVTLGNVIVFKTDAAASNRGLLAHELAHVEQYRALGITEFARSYAADPEPIEAEARRKARQVMRKL